MFRRGPVGGVAGGRFGKSPGGPRPGTWDLGPGGSRDKRGLGVCRRAGWQTQTKWDIETCGCVPFAVAAGPSCTARH